MPEPRIRFTEEDFKRLFRYAPGSMKGFSAADTRGELVARALRKQAAREHEAALRVKLGEMSQTGQTKRTGMTEGGLMERQLEKQRYGGPLQEAQTDYYGAEAGAATARAGLYGTQADVERSAEEREEEYHPSKLSRLRGYEEEDALSRQVLTARSRADLARLSKEEEERDIADFLGGADVNAGTRTETSAVAKPTPSKRRLRPSIMDALKGLSRPFTDVYGGLRDIYEYAYPKR